MKSLVLLVALLGAALLQGCSDRDELPADEKSAPRAWVVVTFEADPSDPAMLQLLDTEVAAGRALERAGAGVIDGNEVGQGTYELFFVGRDGEEMWRVLEPVLAEAPVPWTRVEQREGLRDEDPEVVVP